MSSIAVLGLGAMGTRMATRLIAAGHDGQALKEAPPVDEGVDVLVVEIDKTLIHRTLPEPRRPSPAPAAKREGRERLVGARDNPIHYVD